MDAYLFISLMFFQILQSTKICWSPWSLVWWSFTSPSTWTSKPSYVSLQKNEVWSLFECYWCQLNSARWLVHIYNTLCTKLSCNVLDNWDIVHWLTIVFPLQQTSGADLALLMLEVLEKSKTEPTEDIITRIARWVWLSLTHTTTGFMFSWTRN